MNQIPTPIVHPLTVGQTIVADRPSCACRGATFSRVEGKVAKVIHNQMGYWYYLGDVGVTVRDIWVKNAS